MSNEPTGWGQTQTYNASFDSANFENLQSFQSTDFGYLKPAEHVFRSQSISKNKAETDIVDAVAEDIEHASASTERMDGIKTDLGHKIHDNGDVTYSDGQGEILRDSAERVSVLRADENAIEIGLKIAAEKYKSGENLTEIEVGGSEEFKQKAVEVAVNQGINVKFSDPQLEAKRVQLIEAREHAATSIERMEGIKETRGNDAQQDTPQDAKAAARQRARENLERVKAKDREQSQERGR